MDRFTAGMPYGSAAAPYSPSHPHRGIDFKAAFRTPIIIGGTTIGLVGSTGKSDGPHLHIQAWVNDVANTLNPAQYMFVGGPVIRVGEASEWGKYVTILVRGVNVTYCHLDQINVSVGQIIGDLMDRETVNYAYRAVMDAEPTEEQVKYWVGRQAKELLIGLYKGSEGRRYKANNYDKDVAAAASSNDAAKKLQAVRDALGIK